jgi:hypothetical protein
MKQFGEITASRRVRRRVFPQDSQYADRFLSYRLFVRVVGIREEGKLIFLPTDIFLRNAILGRIYLLRERENI